MRINKLTPAKIANLKPKARQYTMADGLGLTLLVHPGGGKYWRYRYRFYGIAKSVSCGTYPETTIAQARAKRDGYRAMLADGTNPASERERKRAMVNAMRFAAYAENWIAKFQADLTEKSRAISRGRLANWIAPAFGNYPVPAISRQMILAALRKIEDKGQAETARRVRALLASIFEQAVNEALIEFNPVPPPSALVRPKKNGGFAAITNLADYRKLLRDIDSYTGNAVVKCALKFMSLTAVRAGELRQARWEQFDFAAMTWTIPADSMKMKREHVVPLSDAAIDVLRFVYQLSGKDTKHVFPWSGDSRMPRVKRNGFVFTINGKKPISDGTMNKALRMMGYDRTKHVPHGFRKSFSTFMHEAGHDSAVIELCLAHVDSNAIRGIYNKAERLDDRREVMQAWGEVYRNAIPS